jgi:hypothetical protein
MVLAWHFLYEDKKLANGDGRLVVAGETLTHEGSIELCERGLHASRRALDALQYAPGPIVCRVECSGDVIEGGDKLVCTHRKALWLADATAALHEFACLCAESVLHLCGDDPSPAAAIVAKRAWLRGEISDQELDAAVVAARAAAWAATNAATNAAAWSDAMKGQETMLTELLTRLRPEGD